MTYFLNKQYKHILDVAKLDYAELNYLRQLLLLKQETYIVNKITYNLKPVLPFSQLVLNKLLLQIPFKTQTTYSVNILNKQKFVLSDICNDLLEQAHQLIICEKLKDPICLNCDIETKLRTSEEVSASNLIFNMEYHQQSKTLHVNTLWPKQTLNLIVAKIIADLKQKLANVAEWTKATD